MCHRKCSAYSLLPQQLRHLRDIRRNSPRLIAIDLNQSPTEVISVSFFSKDKVAHQGPKMPHVCALITIAMQLTCIVDKQIVCTDNQSVGQLLNVPSCERVFFRQVAPNVSFTQEGPLN
jgi:hypothetical protein